MTAALFDSVARIAQHEAAARWIAAIGVVGDGIHGDDHAVSVELRETGLLLPRVPIAVPVPGQAATPRAGDLVVLLFADGDVNAPVVIGTLYHADLAPPEHGEGDVVFALPAGEQEPTFRAVLRGADPKLTVTMGDVEVVADDTKVHVRTGDAEATVEAAGNGRIELRVGDASVTVTGRGDIVLKTSGKLSLQANDVEIKGQSSVAISGPRVEVN
ncbi:phage baseplate assembly protein V [Mycobacterium sp. RTGN6]|uniref:phage baseplate assembly protein V n=1 Tax=Mycobacterium sp. RTGN6 TaxID=3016521 RepID=UPI0029C73306|nr:phage baseplate assembly protein V [Mycobacterium sp. RTGN6]